jgi:hypothetical protein
VTEGEGAAYSAAPNPNLGPPFDGQACAWCTSPSIGTVLVEPPATKRDARGKITSLAVGRRVPVCSRHRAQLELGGDRHTADAARKTSARQWNARQGHLFDDVAFRTYGVRQGWWTECDR